jgi:O-antigen/teichoic acid export membrane protein
MSARNRILINMFSQAAGTVAPIAVGFFATPIIITLLGKEGFGLQSLAAVVGGFFGFLDMSLDVPISKFMAQYKAQGDGESIARLLDTALLLYLCIGILGLLALVGISKPLSTHFFRLSEGLSQTARVVFILAGVSFLVSLIQSWANACLIGLERFDRVNLINVAGGIISPLIGIVSVYAGFGIVGFVASGVVVMALGAAAAIALVFRFLPEYKPKPKFHLPTFLSIRGYLGAGVVLRITGWVSGGLDRTLIGAWINVGGVTAYALQWSLISPLQSLLSNTFGYLFPMSSSYYAKDAREEFKRIFLKSARLYGALTCTTFGLLFLFGIDFLKLWVGADIAEQVNHSLPLLVIAGFVAQLGSWFLNGIVLGTGNLRIYYGFTLAKIILLGCALPLGVYLFGFTGAAGAYLVASTAEAVYLHLVVNRIIQVSIVRFLYSSYLRPLLATVSLCATCLLIPISSSSAWSILGFRAAGFTLTLWTLFFLTAVYSYRDVQALLRYCRDLYIKLAVSFNGKFSSTSP